MTTFCKQQCHYCYSPHNLCAVLLYSVFYSLQVLVCRNYRGDVDMSEIEHFMTLLMDKEEEGTLSPILAHGGVRFMWIKHNNLYCILVHHSTSVIVLILNCCFYLVFRLVYNIYFTCYIILNTENISGCNIQEKCQRLAGLFFLV